MSITPAQCRGARAMLKMSRDALAKAAGVGGRTVVDFESGLRTPIKSTHAAIQSALEKAGVEFTNGDQPGVRLRKLGT